jgi:hypothetical protein
LRVLQHPHSRRITHKAVGSRFSGGNGVRRMLDGVVQDEAAFLFSEPARWRVRHRNGEEIVVRQEDWWTRSAESVARIHDRSEPGTTPHHNGYL